MNWAAPIASGAVAAILPLTLIAFGRFFPYQPPPEELQMTPQQLQALTRKHWWIYLVLLIAMLAFGALFTWAWTQLLIGLDNWCLSRLPPSSYLIKPSFVVWMLPALFLAIISMILPLDLLCRLMLRRNYSEYLRMENFRYGFNGTKAFIAFAVPVVILSGLFVGLACDWYLQVTDDYIAWNRLWSFTERRYSFGEVEKLIEIPKELDPNGNVKHGQRHFIVFTDGTVWGSEEMGSVWYSYVYEHEMLEFIESKTGRRIIYAKSTDGLLP